MKRLLILPAVLVLGAWGPCRPKPHPTPANCIDRATTVRHDIHDGNTTVWYADGPNGPHPVGVSTGAEACIHPYE